MNQLSRFVSLHPYFKVPSDKMPYLKAILPEFVAKTRNETGNRSILPRRLRQRRSAAGALGKRGCDASAGAGDGRLDSHRSPRTSRRARETKRTAGPSETCLVRIAQLIAIVASIILKHRRGVHRGDCARAARARTQMFRRSPQSSTASLTEIRLRLRPGQMR
jgi:hypothetical protein